ncbi:Hsp20/alpha crystallin family protein [Flavobacterium zepuense]|uniref:Hsp20/alpha crystallin family protein n=1 Tax=Flavobacterium zepuense TaxID=2593302 RepID=A0A552V2V4_9FLAO|nr:Hsp20/alpha crystallin family protein [Flavobacterium zepuense]TRW24804.1 Hsp20/alpha crystallin family protein [Flavobacterium zepuense]
MNLVKRNYSNTDQIFRDLLGGTQYVQKAIPAVNITETEQAFTVQLVVPGFEKADFNIEVDNNLLTISSEVKSEKNEGAPENKFTKREFVQSSFKRSFKLPETINEQDINAAYHAGILSITLPKKEEALPKAKRIVEIS